MPQILACLNWCSSLAEPALNNFSSLHLFTLSQISMLACLWLCNVVTSQDVRNRDCTVLELSLSEVASTQNFFGWETMREVCILCQMESQLWRLRLICNPKICLYMCENGTNFLLFSFQNFVQISFSILAVFFSRPVCKLFVRTVTLFCQRTSRKDTRTIQRRMNRNTSSINNCCNLYCPCMIQPRWNT